MGSVVKRRTEQAININSVIWLLFGVSVVVFWFWALGNTNKRAAIQSQIRMTKNAGFMQGIYPGTGTPAGGVIIGMDGNTRIAPTPFPSLSPDLYMTPEMLATYASRVFWATVEARYTPTPSPTVTVIASETPNPTITPTMYSVDVVFKYSYYNPKLGGVNCFQWDAVLNDCMSMMANGEDWRPNFGKVVACPPDIALGTVIEVTYPDALKGLWTCKDRGSAIVDRWIDFLDIAKRYDWGEPVSAKMYPPTVPLEEISKGTH